MFNKNLYNNPYHEEDISKVKFLVSGGAGFIGSNLFEYLLKYGAGHIRVLDNLSNGYMENIEANSFLATKISFMNEIARLCELLGTDVDMVRKGVCSDDRIAHRPFKNPHSNLKSGFVGYAQFVGFGDGQESPHFGC